MNKKLMVILLVLLLSGCKQTTEFSDVQSRYNEMTVYSGTYKYEVDFGGVFEYVCSYELTGNEARLTVVSPEEIAGITAVTDSTGEYLVYDDISIKTYLPENADSAPVSALHRLIYDIRSKQPSVFTENEVFELTFEDGDYTKLATLSKEDFAILSCEIFYKGDRILNITLQ